jgi:hypothetical protein
MAANSLKNLSVHLEKVAYGLAAVFGLFFILCPSLFTGPDRSADIEKARDEINTRLQENIEKLIPAISPIPQDVEKQWAVNRAASPWISPWTVEARPGVVQVLTGGGIDNATHEIPVVTKIAPQRDPEKRRVFLHVEAAPGKLENAALKSAKLQRKKSGDTKWTEVKDFSAELDKQPFAYDDYEVEAGQTYSYQFVTKAAAQGEAKLDPKEETKTSAELALKKPIPYEFAIKIVTAIPFDAATNTPASLNGEISWWDYAKGVVTKVGKASWKENDTFGSKVPDSKDPKTPQDRYRITNIPAANTVKVQDRGVVTLQGYTLTVEDNKRPVDLPAEVTPESVKAEEEAAAKAAEEAKAKEEAEAAAGEEEKTKKSAKAAKKATEEEEEEEDPDADLRKRTPKGAETAKKPSSKDKDTKTKKDTKKSKFR